MSAAAMVLGRLRRLLRRTLFRPIPAILLFGAVMATSNWLWYGSGLFLSRAAGLALMATFGLAVIGALAALTTRRRPLRALTFVLVAAVGLPLVALVVVRMKTGAPLLMHDGAYQTEEAIRFLLSGQDPYGQDYTTTSMRLWHWYVNRPIDPSLFHFVYYPATFLMPMPFALLASTLHLAFDVRLVWLAVMGLTTWALLAMPWRWEWRYLALCCLFLDPFFYFAQGRNDVLWLGAITLGVLASARGKPVFAALGLGVAFALKPFALFFLPLYAVALWRNRARTGTGSSVLGLALLALPALLTILPFFAWQPGAFWADTVGFVAGTDPHSYPIGGFGVARLLLLLHVIPDASSPFPFGPLQAVVCLPAVLWAGWRVWRRPTIARVLSGGTLVLALFLLSGRFLNDNYVADALYLAVLAGVARRGAGAALRAPYAVAPARAA